MNYYNYISFYLLFIFVLCYLFLEIESLTPGGRYGHSSVLVENKIYFFGGEKSENSYSNETFYLDVSQPFNIASQPLHDLKEMPIKSSWGTTSLNYADNEHIYLFGGQIQDINTNAISYTTLVYRFNLKLEKWDIPTIKGIMPINRMEMKAISNNSGRIYIFGGQNVTDLSFNDMITFNVVDLSWSISYPSSAPRLAGYSATLLPNGVIVYIGGYDGLKNVDISQISLYDTNSLTWSVQIAKPTDQIDNRDGHSAVLASDGRIIIYGGSKLVAGNDKVANFQANPNLAVLNTSTNPFEWTTPLVASYIGVPSLTSHTADLVGNYMIMAYGNVTQPNAYPASTNGNIYIMDINNYTWVNIFEPPTPSKTSTPTSTSTSTSEKHTPESQTDVNNQLTAMKVAIITIGAIVGAAVLTTIVFFGYKWYQRYKRNIVRIAGNN